MSIRRVRRRGRYRESVADLLADFDDAFVPPLTGSDRDAVARSSDEHGPATLGGYVERCLDRPMLGAFDGDDLVGFCSFHPVVRSRYLDGYTPANHVSILLVRRPYRNRGVATRFYRRLLTDLDSALRRPYVTTKTWSTNHAHLRVLDKHGFDCVARVEDDRGDGVDTVYYAAETDY
ncbi:MAG: GNAT family N-acetyltransferase [Haloplanus sp.]